MTRLKLLHCLVHNRTILLSPFKLNLLHPGGESGILLVCANQVLNKPLRDPKFHGCILVTQLASFYCHDDVADLVTAKLTLFYLFVACGFSKVKLIFEREHLLLTIALSVVLPIQSKIVLRNNISFVTVVTTITRIHFVFAMIELLFDF